MNNQSPSEYSVIQCIDYIINNNIMTVETIRSKQLTHKQMIDIILKDEIEKE